MTPTGHRNWSPDVRFRKNFKVAFMIMLKESKKSMVLLSGQRGGLWKLENKIQMKILE